MDIDLQKTFDNFSEFASAESLNRGMRRLLFIALIENVDAGFHTDLDAFFFRNFQSLIDLLDELQQYQAKKQSE